MIDLLSLLALSNLFIGVPDFCSHYAVETMLGVEQNSNFFDKKLVLDSAEFAFETSNTLISLRLLPIRFVLL